MVGHHPVEPALALEVVVVEVRPRPARHDLLVHAGGHHHDPRGSRALQTLEKQVGQQEVTDVVGAEGELEPLGRELWAVLERHQTGVLDQEVEREPELVEGGGKRADRGERREVQLQALDLRAGDRAANGLAGCLT